MGIKSKSSGAFPGNFYYVSAAGNDSLDGKSSATAWATIGRVNSATLLPGDTVLFNGGDTFNDATLFINQTNVPSGGIKTRPVTVSSFGKDRATLKAGGASLGTYGQGVVVVLDGVSGLIFQNLKIDGASGISSLINSSDFVSGWGQNNLSIVNNVTTAPDSTTTAASLTDNGTNGAHNSARQFPFIVSTSYTASIDFKQGTGRYVSLRGSCTDNSNAVFPWITVDTQAGTIAANGAVSASSITSLGSGWFNATMTWTAGEGGAQYVVIATSNVSTAPPTSETQGNSYAGSSQSVFAAKIAISSPTPAFTNWGLTIQNSNGAVTMDTVTVKNCDITNCIPTGYPSYSEHIRLIGFSDTGVCGSLNNINILNNTLHGSTGVSSQDCFGLDGYACGANVGSNVTNVTVQGNLCYNIGGYANDGGGIGTGTGLMGAQWNGGVIQFNFAHDCGYNSNTCGGGIAIWTYGSNNVLIQFNEVANQRRAVENGCDMGAYNIDNGCTNCFIQYNYSQGCSGPAWEGTNQGTNDVNGIYGWGPCTVRYNISENDNQGLSVGVIGAYANAGGIWYVYNNTVFCNTGSTGSGNPPALIYYGYTGTQSPSSIFANNLFYSNQQDTFGRLYCDQGAAGAAVGSAIIKNNCYFTPGVSTPSWQINGTAYTSLATAQAAGYEVGSITSDPLFIHSGSGGTIMPNVAGSVTGPNVDGPKGYKLQSGSPCIGVGLDLTHSPYNLSVGSRDYFGNTIPHGTGTGYNIGAYGGT